jgi:hypothetical protein
MTYVCEEGVDFPQDVSGNGDHITAMTCTWGTSDVLAKGSWNAAEGFYVATPSTAPYIPALADGLGLAANGLAITNRGGYTHNGGEYTILESDPAVVPILGVSGTGSASDGDFTYAPHSLLITEPSGGWSDEIDPDTSSMENLYAVVATMANGLVTSYTATEPAGGWLRTFNPQTATVTNFLDVAATLASEISGTANAYTVTAPTVSVLTFDPNTDSFTTAKAVLATLLINLQDEGVIG